jgi:hypothetical protein
MNYSAKTPKGHTVEAHGIKGINSKVWRKTFKSIEQAYEWAEKNDAEIYATRDLH